MLMAHIFAHSLPTCDHGGFKIAHFNHGLRPDSDQDEKLVREFATTHDIEFVSEKWSSPNASENTARKARHQFLANTTQIAIEGLSEPTGENEAADTRNDGLAERRARNSSLRSVCENTKTNIATAHHLDDLVESITINLTRGTGWRGLAVLNRPGYIRPLLTLEKFEIKSLARELGLKWREDSTNQSAKYLRNRLREHTQKLSFDTKWQLLQLRNRQVQIAREIDDLLQEYQLDLQRQELYKTLKNNEFDILPELLHYWLKSQNVKATRPEILRLLDAILTYQPQKKFQLSGNQFVLIRKTDFILI